MQELFSSDKKEKTQIFLTFFALFFHGISANQIPFTRHSNSMSFTKKILTENGALPLHIFHKSLFLDYDSNVFHRLSINGDHQNVVKVAYSWKKAYYLEFSWFSPLNLHWPRIIVWQKKIGVMPDNMVKKIIKKRHFSIRKFRPKSSLKPC